MASVDVTLNTKKHVERRSILGVTAIKQHVCVDDVA